MVFDMDSRRQICSIVVWTVLCVCLLCKFVFAGDKIRIRDVEVLTLYQGKMTTGRRSSPVLQLRCTGGSAGCSAFVPEVIQCYNRGWDGYDAQWECKTDMDNKYRFGKIDVNCEGFDYPDDPYILRGSCGLQYTIELTEEGRAKQRSSDYQGWGDYQERNRKRWSSSSGIGDLVMLVIVGVIFYMLFKTCASNRHIDTDSVPPPYPQEPNNRGRQVPDPSAPPPPYSPDPPGFKRDFTQGNTAPPPYPEAGFRSEYTQGAAGSQTTGSSTNSNSGFWTGAAAGGLMGYLFGGRTRTQNYYQNPYNYNSGWGGGWGSSYNAPHYGNTGGWFGNWFGGGSRSYSHRPSHNSYGFSSFGGSSSSSSRPSSGTRTVSGTGGTSRR